MYTVEVTPATLPTTHLLGMFASVASAPTRSVTGFAGSVPSVKPGQSSEAVPASSSVPSVSTVSLVRSCERTSVPAPVFSSALTVGTSIVAVFPEATNAVGTTRVCATLLDTMDTSALNATPIDTTSRSSVAVAAVLKMALLSFAHVTAAPS